MVADAGYGQTAEFRQGLTNRDLPYVVGVPATITVRPADAVPETPERSGRGRRPNRVTAHHIPRSNNSSWTPENPCCATSSGATAPAPARTTRPPP
ncbi:transposase [Nocardia sp. NPDC059691]|uniref:transposase n=1 Tax=Nocardia sp. NPDC059691 TaxID=3346908 RepID=UPI0036C20636